jgi:multisubunit Na+/H+ antiporter MnhB subunit
MLFDLGVFLVVVGVTVLILLRLGYLHDDNRPGNDSEEAGN